MSAEYYIGLTKGWWAIRGQTRSNVGHALLRRGDTVIESVARKGVIHHKMEVQPGERLFRVPDMDDEMWQYAWEFAALHVGEKYDWRGVFRFVSRRDHSHKRPKWFCSELVFAACLHAGLPLLARTKPSLVSPAMLGLSPLLVEVDP